MSRDSLGAVALALLKAGVGALVLRLGFSHVSDDDYARTVIAQTFAHAPRLDPSGTSWLPFPFWVEGLTMMALGRTLAVARAVAIVLGAASVAAPYLAMVRLLGVARPVAASAVVVSMALPWSAWLGVAAVPEGWSAAIVAAAAMAMGRPRGAPWAAAALLVSSLTRYEAWPACAVFAALTAWRVRRQDHRARALLLAAVALLGPAAWMAWNHHAHGSALHFVARVTAFRHAVGAANGSFADKLLGYPRALVVETPEVAVLGLAAALGAWLHPAIRARWSVPLVTAVAILAFLIAGDLGDGAPTHHAARALAPVWWIFAGAGVDAIHAGMTALAPGSRRHAAAWTAIGVAAALWVGSLIARWPAFPGQSDAERRDAQIARGESLRHRGVEQAWIYPCSFEHFALLAAWGAPERATIAPRSGAPPTSRCPVVKVP